MNSKQAKKLRLWCRQEFAGAPYRKYIFGKPPHPLRTKFLKQVEVGGKLLGLEAGVPTKLSSVCLRYRYQKYKRGIMNTV
jgi:hypothetical protein